MATPTKTVHRLKVTLREVKPPVWRRIDVPSDVKLSTLAEVLEAAMGWLGGHLHAFEAAGVFYEVPEDEGFGFRSTVDERKARLADVLPDVQSKLRWDYDFGDGWEHDVVVEAIQPREVGVEYPICVAGRRACPPDDCGGPWGYGNMLAALADRAHPDHLEVTAWAPVGFDPEAFDAALVTELMQAAPPPRRS